MIRFDISIYTNNNNKPMSDFARGGKNTLKQIALRCCSLLMLKYANKYKTSHKLSTVSVSKYPRVASLIYSNKLPCLCISDPIKWFRNDRKVTFTLHRHQTSKKKLATTYRLLQLDIRREHDSC